jgi:hypothetical protein
MEGLFVNYPTVWADPEAWAKVRPLIAMRYGHSQDIVDKRLEAYVHRRTQAIVYHDKDLESVLPTTGLLADYVQYTQGQESPLAYHVLCFLCLLGAAVRANAWVEQRRYKLYPSLPVLLVGPSGEVKKGASMRMARSMIDKAMPKRLCVVNKGTERGIILAMRRVPHAVTLIAPEFSQTFSKQRHMADIEKFITQLLDHEEYADVTEMHDAQRLPDGYFFTVLGGSNMSWLRKLPTDALTGGFLPRFFIVNREKRRDVVATPSAEPAGLQKKLYLEIRTLVNGAKGEIRKSAEASTFYERYYTAHALAPKPTDNWQSYQNRRHNRVLMMSMLLGLCQGRMQIEIEDMRHAALMLDSLDVGVREVFEELGLTRVGEVRMAVLDLVNRSTEGMGRDAVLRLLTRRYDKKDIEQQLQNLLSSGEVRRGPAPGRLGQVRYWPVRR